MFFGSQHFWDTRSYHPTNDMSLSKTDLKEREEQTYLTEEALRSHSASQALPSIRPRRIWPPLELYNPDYIMYKEQMELLGPMHDFIKENIVSRCVSSAVMLGFQDFVLFFIQKLRV